MAECVLSLIVAETVQRSTNQDKQGYETGYRFVEQMSERRLGTDPLEVMKFLCKELWFGMFGKQVDKLQTVWKSNFYGAFVLNRRVDLHAIDATRARWRGDAGSSPLDGASTAASSPRMHPTHWFIYAQVANQP